MDLPFLQHNFIEMQFEDVVSILVLMDLPFLLWQTLMQWWKWECCFNPCSYGSSVLTRTTTIQCFGEIYVSILVLMDLPFLPTIDAIHTHLKTVSFNPCSYGSSVLTGYWTMTKEQYLQKFQSLFLWIFRSYIPDGDDERQKRAAVSILVLMDLPFLHLTASRLELTENEFQSLFLWIFRSY